MGFIEAFLERSTGHGNCNSWDLNHTLSAVLWETSTAVPTFPLGRTVATVIPRLLFAMETQPRSIAHFRVTLKITSLLNESCTICRLILGHCIDCPNNTLTKK
jgi:hypothetical protein